MLLKNVVKKQSHFKKKLIILSRTFETREWKE